MSSNSTLFAAMYAGVLAPLYCACANCENYSRAIIISFVGKYAANTTRGRLQFEGEIYSRKYGSLLGPRPAGTLTVP